MSVHAGDASALPGGGMCRFIAPHGGSSRLWEAWLDLPLPLHPYLRRWGRPIAYSYAEDVWPIEMYQTVYAARPGSAEMPSAGRAFSHRVLAALEARGVVLAAVTLHTGVASLEAHEAPHEEWFEIDKSAATAINAGRAAARRVVAVGTTVVRALESSVDDSGLVRPSNGWTDLVITPQRGIATVDALLTGFHEPRASHLSMLEALAGRRHLQIAYVAALDGKYLWHEFGDLHLIL